MCSSDRVTSVVAMDRMTVAATIATMAHSGKCAGAAMGGGGGGRGATEGSGGGRVAHAAGARLIAAVRKTARPPSAVIIRRVGGMERRGRGCDDAGRWFMVVAPSVAWADVVGRFVSLFIPTQQRSAIGVAL